jgi:hypothetical protein
MIQLSVGCVSLHNKSFSDHEAVCRRSNGGYTNTPFLMQIRRTNNLARSDHGKPKNNTVAVVAIISTWTGERVEPLEQLICL